MIAKVDQYLIEEVLKNEHSDEFGERKFLENVFVIVSVCDPVHRALSNYLHVTRDVKYKTQFTIQGYFLDKMYPGLKKLPFDDFISKYLPKLDDFGENHFIKNFMTVNYTTVLEEMNYFGDRLILVDGTEFKESVRILIVCVGGEHIEHQLRKNQWLLSRKLKNEFFQTNKNLISLMIDLSKIRDLKCFVYGKA